MFVAVAVGGLVIATRTDDPTGKAPADQPKADKPKRRSENIDEDVDQSL